jgi:cytoskeletal protein CcmA (bactofilin family)
MAHIESTRAVVESGETYDGRIFPSEQAEIPRPVRVRPDATVLGSVYGGSVTAESNATIDGSVMAADEVKLDDARIAGEVGTEGKVVARRAEVDGTVTGRRVRLVDCVVRGNVVGSEVILENCVVFGLVGTERSLTLEDTLCYTFRGEGETVVDKASVVLPQAIVEGDIEIRTPVTVVGLGPADTGRTPPKMGTEDLYRRDERSFLTLAPRLLNLERVKQRLSELETAVSTATAKTRDEARLSVDELFDVLDIDPRHVSAVG